MATERVTWWVGEKNRTLQVYAPCECGCSPEWYLSGSDADGHGFTVRLANKRVAAQVGKLLDNANARLIAAAPDLLAEVVKLREAVTACGIRLSFLMDEHADDYSRDNAHWIQLALKAEDSAIAVEHKARGEA